jgi:3-hydroxyisobutyrate dehydrogenase-like beta-hydroxyacid dehydrogenase
VTGGENRIAFIGPGQMGLPMVRRLVQAGHPVTTFARRADARAACAEIGATAVADAREAVREAAVVVVCLYADAQLRALASGPEGFLDAMQPGALLIVHTTGSPETSRALAEQGAGRRIRVVDAPVSGSAREVEEGAVTVLLGGAPDDIEAARAIVRAYGNPVLTVGPLGSAMAVKLLNNALFAAQMQLVGEVERVAARFDIDMGTVGPAIRQSSGASYALDVVTRFGSVAGVVDAAGHFLDKDVSVVEEVAQELGIDLGVLGYVNRHGPLRFRARDDGGAQ